MKKPQSAPKLDMVNNAGELLLLLKEPEIKRFIDEQNEKYKHWDEIRHYADSVAGLRPEEVWKLMKLIRENRYKKIAFGELELKYVNTNDISKTLHELDQKMGTGVQKEYFISEKELEKNLINSLMEEAIASSQLEGASTTRNVAKEMLRRGRKPKNESEQMIVNAYKTILFIREVKDQKLTPELLLRLHDKITRETLDEKHVGRFRNNDEVVVTDASGEVFHQPPPYQKVEELVQKTCEFANEKQDEFVHPIIKAIILHFVIGYIHPFENGNGRTARTIFYWYLLKAGYWLFEFMPISRVIKKAPSKYARAYLFSETDDLDLTYFINFNLRQINMAMNEFFDYLAQEKEEFEKTKRMIGKGLNFRQTEMVINFQKHPTKLFTIKELMNTYSVTYETARTDMVKLEKLGHIEMTTDGRTFYYSYQKKNELEE